MINKIVIAGGNGFLGSALTSYFKEKANQVILLARNKVEVSGKVSWMAWDGSTIGEWATALENADVVINLAGKNVNCRYTDKNKKLIYDSRLNSTSILGEAIKLCKQPPAVWINSSSATIYRDSYDKFMTEANGEIGDDFSMDVCNKWEAAFNEMKIPGVRKIILRTSIVLGHGGGAMPALKTLVRLGLGGKQGSGKQYVSWIHQKDFCSAVEHVLNSRHAEGIYNVTAPNPLPNNYFMKALRTAMNIPAGIFAPQLILALGAIFIRTETELILKSRKVFPKRLLDEGFVFEFNEAKDALEDLCRKEARIRRSYTLLH
jgi:uncharacterized protein (TIGR01777 family)